MPTLRLLCGITLAAAATFAQAAIQLDVEITPTRSDPDQVFIVQDHGDIPGAFTLSFTLETDTVGTLTRETWSANAQYGMHTDDLRSPVFSRLALLDSQRVRPSMLKDGTADFEFHLLSGVAPSKTTLTLRAADAFVTQPDPLWAHAYERTLRLSALNPLGSSAASPADVALDEAAIAAWLTNHLGQTFTDGFQETYQMTTGDLILQKTLFGDVVLKSVSVVPEPSAMAMQLMGLAAVAVVMARRRPRH